MNVRFLIDRFVKLQAGLLAELATSGGVRAPLAELSDQMFIHLAEELDRRGVSRKVSADMFGMALRAYQKKTQRLAMSSTDSGSSLWYSVLDYLDKQSEATRADIFQRFCRDDEAQLRAVLFDLTESGLAKVEGTGPQARYQLEEIERSRLTDSESFADMLWLTIFRDGPISRERLIERSRWREGQCDSALSELVKDGRVAVLQTPDGISYESSRFEVVSGNDQGWEAALLDHYQAFVKTLVGVLPGLTGKGTTPPAVGGFTYSLDVWEDHPLHEEVAGVLAELRSRLSDLRKRVDTYNETVTVPSEYSEVRIYGGQNVTTRKAAQSDSVLPPPIPQPTEN